jgi:hypothetical protein
MKALPRRGRAFIVYGVAWFERSNLRPLAEIPMKSGPVGSTNKAPVP